MSTGTQVEMDWAGTDAAAGGARGGAGLPPTAPDAGTDARYLTDEEILGIEPTAPAAPNNRFVIPSEARNLSGDVTDGKLNQKRDSSGETRPRNDKVLDETEPVTAHESRFTNHDSRGGAPMPSWMQSAAADPRHGAEAQQLWREHQEFRTAFASPEEARAVKELLPGGVSDVLSLREATQSVERIDAALFSGDARAQSEVVTELARANPAAFRSLFAEAAKVLAGLGERGNEAGGKELQRFDRTIANEFTARPTLRENREGWGTRNSEDGGWRSEVGNRQGAAAEGLAAAPEDRRPLLHRDEQDAGAAATMPSTNHQSPVTSQQSPFAGAQGKPVTNHASRQLGVSESQITNHGFDPAAYAAFERATNDAVARDVRGAIGDTLARVLPDGVAEGAARRIGEDIFHEIHRALAADRMLSEQVAAVLRPPPSPNFGYDGQARRSLGEGEQARQSFSGGGPRFGAAEQQHIASLLAGRAKQLVPSVARRVIGEWTSSVLNTSRTKAARRAAAASRVDIAAPGGSLDSMPLRQMSPREEDYASMSDEEILGI